MKNKFLTIKILTILPLLLVLLALPFMPDTIPAHYGLNGTIDRMGSKYELLIFPIISIIMYLVFYFSMKYEIKKKDDEKNIKILVITFTIIQAFELINTVWFGLKAYTYSETAVKNSILNTGKIVYIAIAVTMIILGNIMPKARNNGVFGLRTKWSRANDLTWQKSQRFGGAMLIITGLAMIAVIIFIKKSPLWEYISFGLIFLTVPLSLIGSYLIYRKYKEEN